MLPCLKHNQHAGPVLTGAPFSVCPPVTSVYRARPHSSPVVLVQDEQNLFPTLETGCDLLGFVPAPKRFGICCLTLVHQIMQNQAKAT